MKTEILHGVEFLCTLLLSNGANEEKSRAFCDALRVVLIEHFNNHWDPEYPQKGSAYRCIRIHHDRAEPLVDRAAFSAQAQQVVELLPTELTLWFDPANVSYRIGENGGRIKTIYYAGAKNQHDHGAPLTPRRQTSLNPNSPPHNPGIHLGQSSMSIPPQQQHIQQNTLNRSSAVYVPDAGHGMGGRHTPAFTPVSPPGQHGPLDFDHGPRMFNPYSKNTNPHNPHNLLMAAH